MQQVLIIKPSSLADIVHGLQTATSIKAQVDDVREAGGVPDQADAARHEAEAGDLRLLVNPDEELLPRLEGPVPGRVRTAAGRLHGDDDERHDDAVTTCRWRTRSSSCRR